MDTPMVHVWTGDFGHVQLTQDFVDEARAKWPGEYVLRSSWLDRLCGIAPISEPKWQREIEAPLKALIEQAWMSGHSIHPVKTLAAIEAYL
jgi:hypothetical protein